MPFANSQGIRIHYEVDGMEPARRARGSCSRGDLPILVENDWNACSGPVACSITGRVEDWRGT
jgi:hypothetical protein